MRALIFGKTGQVAIELKKLFADEGHEVIALGRDDANLEDSVALESSVFQHSADIIINAAAYTNVDGAEQDRELALTVNALAPFCIANAAQEVGAPFIHISTDYVFDGSGETPWKVDDTINPINHYGFSKVEGERMIASTPGRNIILRTSWVFSNHGRNFVSTILSAGTAQNNLRIVGDQIGGPTSAADIAKAILVIAGQEHNAPGVGTQIVHFCGHPFVSWAEFGEAIIKRAGLDTSITAISSAEYPTAATRPKNSRLDVSGLASLYGIKAPEWRAALDIYFKRITHNE